MSTDQQTESQSWLERELYEAAIGPSNTHYYLSRFERFASGGGRTSWNWPAFFISLLWLLYRKMWAHAALYLFVPSVLAVVLAVVFGSLFGGPGVLLAWFLQIVAMYVVVPMYANAWYFRTVSRRVERVHASGADRNRQLRTLYIEGGTSPVALGIGIAILVVVPFMLGILAAIAIPAYQDYTIRAQISEGPVLAAESKAAVAETVLNTGSVPANRAAAGMTPNATDTRGRYVASVDIVDGRIDIVYGGEAHAAIAERVLSLTPYVMDAGPTAGQIVWRCGLAPLPEGAAEISPYAPGTVSLSYLPSTCRP